MPANNSSPKITPPPAKVQTAADSALARYPELAIPGLEECSKVFALVAASLDQPPSSSVAKASIGSTHPASPPVGATTSPTGLTDAERSVSDHAGAAGGKQREEWIRRLRCVFDFEITPAASSTLIPFLSSSRRTTNPPPPTKPVHVYLDMLNTGLISLTPPKTASTGPAGAIKVRSRPRAGEWVKISLNAKDLVRVAVGEKVPVKLYQNGKLKIKGDVEKALLLGQLLRITRSQIYRSSAPATSPSKDNTSSSSSLKRTAVHEGTTHGDDLSGEGLQGQGSGSGAFGVGLGAGFGVGPVRARL